MKAQIVKFVIDDLETSIDSLTPRSAQGDARHFENPSPVGEGSLYNIAGQRVSKTQRSAQGDASHLKKGIYIQNGKKVLVK